MYQYGYLSVWIASAGLFAQFSSESEQRELGPSQGVVYEVNRLAEQGWELVTHTKCHYEAPDDFWFKRLVEQEYAEEEG